MFYLINALWSDEGQDMQTLGNLLRLELLRKTTSDGLT
jgi:hypothetical protein